MENPKILAYKAAFALSMTVAAWGGYSAVSDEIYNYGVRKDCVAEAGINDVSWWAKSDALKDVESDNPTKRAAAEIVLGTLENYQACVDSRTDGLQTAKDMGTIALGVTGAFLTFLGIIRESERKQKKLVGQRREW